MLISTILVVALSACSRQPASAGIAAQPSDKEITVFAGSASKPPLDEAAQMFEKQTGVKVYVTYGGSGAVLSQMEISHSGDVYIPGSPDYLAKAEKDNVTDPSSTKIIAYLIPVISVQHGNPENIESLQDLARPGIRVGIGNPDTVCVGLYGIELLDFNNLLTQVTGNIVTQAESCEKTATLLSLKSVDAVLGWDVFHYWDPDKIDTVYLPPEQLPRIGYIPAAISLYTKDRTDAEAFTEFLVSKQAQAIFHKWGYIATEQDARKFAPNAQIGGEYTLPASNK
jgi:molybdate transport system substrate-binding protein